MVNLTLLMIVVLSVGGPPPRHGAVRPPVIQDNATVNVREEGRGGSRLVATSHSGKLNVRVGPGKYNIQATRQDEVTSPQHANCGDVTVRVRKGEARRRVTLTCSVK